MTTRTRIARLIDHTLLRPEATAALSTGPASPGLDRPNSDRIDSGDSRGFILSGYTAPRQCSRFLMPSS